MNWRIVMMVLLIASFFLCSCNDWTLCCKTKPQETPKPQPEKKTTPQAETPVAAEAKPLPRLEALRNQLQATTLHEVWHHHLSKDQIIGLYIGDEQLFVETDKQQLFALDRKTGVPLWALSMGAALDFKPLVFKDKIYLITRARLQILDKKTGSLLVKRDLSFIPCSPAVANDKYIYMGAWNHFVYALYREDKKEGEDKHEAGEQAWRYRIDGYVQGQPAIMDDILFFAATDERIYSIKAETGFSAAKQEEDSRYITRGPNSAGVVAQTNPPFLYVGSRDYNLYCLSFSKMSLMAPWQLQWKFESGGEIRGNPFILGANLYLVSHTVDDNTTFYVLNTANGQQRWSLENGLLLLFSGKQHDWIIQKDKQLSAIKSGEPGTKFSISEFDLFVTNIQDNIGYLATQDGYIFAVEE